MSDEFYIGYSGEMPREIGRRVRTAVIGVFAAAAAVIGVALAASTTLAPSRFEFGRVSTASGVLRRVPYPTLDTGDGRVWLVGRGKQSANRLLAGIADGAIALRGSRIHRGPHEMLEVHAAAAVHRNGTGLAAATPTTIARGIALRGEIVDSKCFLGVMNPAEGEVHRDCARRCLSGGMPPMLLVRDGTRREALVLLVSADGEALGREAAGAAGQPVEVIGTLTRDDSNYIFYVRSVQTID